jgi:phage tail-like protein
MSTTATAVDPRATFNYGIEIDRIEQIWISSCNVPEMEIAEIVHHGAGSAHGTKTGGKLKFGDITIEKAMPADKSDAWAWTWFTTVRDPETGTGQPASVYKKNITILHYGTGTNVIDKWECYGVWPSKVLYSKNDSSQEGERMIETVILKCDRYKRIILA